MYALQTQRNIMTKTLIQVNWCELNVSVMHACMLCKCNTLWWWKPRIRVFGVKWMYQQCTHVCIANTMEYYDKKSVSGNLVRVECISNACMHALQTQGDYHDKNPESGYLVWSECISNAHMYALQTQRNIMTKTLIQVNWCELNVSAMHACMLCKCNRLWWWKPWIRVFSIKWMYQQCLHVCIANTTEYNDKNPDSGKLVWVERISNACMHALQMQQTMMMKTLNQGI